MVDGYVLRHVHVCQKSGHYENNFKFEAAVDVGKCREAAVEANAVKVQLLYYFRKKIVFLVNFLMKSNKIQQQKTHQTKNKKKTERIYGF